MTAPSANPATSRSDFRRRLGYYTVGLAIGCVMAGMIYRARKAEVEREKAAAQAAEPSPEQPNSSEPPASR